MTKVRNLPDNEETPETRDINFIITDGTNAIQGAKVSIENLNISGTTGSAGGCTLRNVPDGEQLVIVSKSGYDDVIEVITVPESDTTFTLQLEKPPSE